MALRCLFFAEGRHKTRGKYFIFVVSKVLSKRSTHKLLVATCRIGNTEISPDLYQRQKLFLFCHQDSIGSLFFGLWSLFLTFTIRCEKTFGLQVCIVSNVHMQSNHDDCSHKGEMRIVGQVGVPMYPWIRIKIGRWNRREPWRWCRGEKQLPMSAHHWTGTFECSSFQFCFGGTYIHTKHGLYVHVHTKVALKALVPSDTYHHTYAPDKPGWTLLCY